MKKPATIAILVAAPLALGACSAMTTPGGTQSAENASGASLDDYFAGRLEAGRTHLAHGRVTAAIDAFRQARVHRDYAADAANGLAVAYARIGRDDLAERYFREAISLAPENEKFARNLARLEGRVTVDAPVFAEAQDAPIETAPAEMPAMPEAVSGMGFAAAFEPFTPTRPGAEARPNTIMVAARAEQPARPLAAATQRPLEIRVGSGAPQVAAANREVFITTQGVTRVTGTQPYRRGVQVAQGGAGDRYPVRIQFGN